MEYANYIRRCIEIARRGEYYVAPNPMVGAVLVGPNPDPSLKGRETIIAEGWHERYGEGHAEVNCFRNFEISDFRFQIYRLVRYSFHWSRAAITARRRLAQN